uniref:NTF2 domain-containing protein n=1 Tax=Cannabis sativa TaxID=3483 RepID=A0A803PGH8_CANSA
MSNAYPGPVSAVQVGSYFVGQYYQVLQQQPDLVYQFYSESSSMVRIDGDSTDTVSEMLQIHSVIMSLNFTAIEIKTINSLESWNGGILVVVSGSVKAKDFAFRRNFIQTFFLAPQEKGYFVLNDVFQYINDETIYQQHQTPELSESKFDSQVNIPSPHPEPPVSDYDLEEEARDYVNSVHIEDDPVDVYSVPEQQQQEVETEVVVEESPVEEASAPFETVANAVQEAQSVAVEEPVGESVKKTYASILLAKGQSAPSNAPPAAPPVAPSVAPQTSFTGTQASSDWNHQYVEQQSYSPSPVVPDSGVEAADEGYGFDDEEEIEEEFKYFGRIKPDGVFIRSRKDIGLCYAFVEFEDILGVHNALKDGEEAEVVTNQSPLEGVLVVEISVGVETRTVTTTDREAMVSNLEVLDKKPERGRNPLLVVDDEAF